jgi:hypothetical protein
MYIHIYIYIYICIHETGNDELIFHLSIIFVRLCNKQQQVYIPIYIKIEFIYYFK